MKKKILVLVMSVVMLSLVGCGASETATTVEETTVETKQEVESITDTEEAESVAEETEEVVEERDNTDFRNACWGDDIETVKKYETKGTYFGEQEGNLLYTDILSGAKVYVCYQFENEKLCGGVYMPEEKYSNSGQYIAHYNSIKEALIKKYGEPSTDKINKFEDDLQIELAGEGDSLKYGYTSYACEWFTDTTRISIGLASQNFDIAYAIHYEDISTYHESDGTEGL